jgi:hypothetical protein
MRVALSDWQLAWQLSAISISPQRVVQWRAGKKGKATDSGFQTPIAGEPL